MTRGLDYTMDVRERSAVVALVVVVVVSCCIVRGVNAQGAVGEFISIDCGSSVNYTDSRNISWVTDSAYISTGENAAVDIIRAVLGVDRPSIGRVLQTLRYFPSISNKQCYSIPEALPGRVYLIRLMFLGGNFTSGQTADTKFGITLGNFLWGSITITASSTPVIEEITFTTSGFTSVFTICLIRNVGTPFISSLEMRLLPDASYQTTLNGFGVYTKIVRFDCGAPPNTPSLRYPNDPYDRLWASDPSTFNVTRFTNSSASLSSAVGLGNEVPSDVLRSAWIAPRNGSIRISWPLASGTLVYWAWLYFAELTSVNKGDMRSLHAFLNGSPIQASDIIPNSVLYQPYNFVLQPAVINITITPAASSTLGPILNAVEVFSFNFYNNSFMTAKQDVQAVGALRQAFNLTDWMGDPCLPVSWQWLTCTPGLSTRVVKIELSNYNLSGEIPVEIVLLTALTELSLDNNNLTGDISNLTLPSSLVILRLQNNDLEGTIPESWGSLLSLAVLTLNNNNLSGSIPKGLMSKINENILTFSATGNPNLCLSGETDCSAALTPSPSPSASTGQTPTSGSKSNVGVIVGVIAGVLVLLLLAAGLLFCVYKGKSAPTADAADGRPERSVKDLSHIEKSFTLAEVRSATDEFTRLIGKGGFGLVYYGKLPDGQEVAVKVNKNNVGHGTQEFLNEVTLLSRVHHRNLVSLVGFCDEAGQQILLYEYMAQGTIAEHLYGESARLDWKTRLDIALNAARGLEYLHNSCTPQVIHRDVKSSNILLTEKLQAKVADFGISRITPEVDRTRGVTTQIKGTHGYLDPEYFMEQRLTTKSDVFSFGIVLLELVTGKAVCESVFPSSSATNIIDWVRDSVRNGNIHIVIDPQLGRNYTLESIWKAVELALLSVDRAGVKRPSMTEVVRGLSEAVQLEKQNVQTPLPDHSPSHLAPADYDAYQRIHAASTSRASRASGGSSNESVATYSWGSNVTAR